MKKVFALMAIVATVGFVSCKKDPKPEPTPKDETVTATITANDVTVEEGASASIGATTNSSASITYSSADANVATVSATGEVTGVKAGSTNITLKVAAVEGKFTAAEKTIKVTVTAKEVPPTPVASIEIDGDFADWSALEAGTFAKAKNDPESPWEAVEEIRCYANPEYVFYYIKYNAEYLEELMAEESEELPIRLCINTDGEFESGYTSYFLEGYDFIVEGGLSAEGTSGWKEFDGNFYQRIGSWVNLLEEGNGLCFGMGNGCEYEIRLNRAMFNEYANTSEVPMPMGDEFQTGIRFYWTSSGSWEELSNMPNSSLEEEMGNGYGYLMRVKTQK